MSSHEGLEISSVSRARRGGKRAKVSIAQANQLALSRQDMGILTKRLLILAMSDITRDDYQLEPIRITAWEYAQLFGIKGKSIYSRIEESARELLEQTIQVKEPNGNWTMFQWVSEARYDGGHDSPDGMACIEIKIHERLSPYLLQLRRDYSIIPTDQLLSFDSFNSTRLFEVIYTASYGGQRTPLRFDIEDLKKRLGLEGKYERFKDFRYVLDKAQRDFTEYTCLGFTYEAQKVGRKYQRVIFSVFANESFSPKVVLPESIAKRAPREEDKQRLLLEVQALDALREISWAQDMERTLATYGAEQVLGIVQYVQGLRSQSRGIGRPIENVAGLVATLLRQGFAPPDKVALEKAEEASGALGAAEVRAIAARVVEQYQSARGSYARTSWEKLDATARQAVHAIMRATLHEFTLDLIEADDWRGMLYEASRAEVMEQHHFIDFPADLRDAITYFRDVVGAGQYSEDDQKRLSNEIKTLTLDAP